MRTIHQILLMGCLLAGFAGGALEVRAQDGSRALQALMIQAQHEAAPADRRMAAVEYKLRRVFQFPHYRYIGEGRTELAARGEGTIRLPQGHRLEIKDAGGSQVQVRWFRGGEALLSTGVSVSRDGPVVLGGIPSGEGTLILVLTEL